jgi:hypothetical protein
MLDPQIFPSMDIDMIMDTDTETDIQYTPRTHTYTQNGTNGKTENGNFRLFAANRKRKRQTSVCLLQTKTENGSLFPLVGKQ